MNLRLIFLVLLSFNRIAYSQTVTGYVMDESKQPLPFTKIVDTVNQTFTLSDIKGKYSLKIKKNSVVRFSYIGKVDQNFKFTSSTPQDTINQNIVLFDNIKVLKTVEVSAERIKPVAARMNHNILDYAFLTADQFLILKTVKGDRTLCIDGIDTTYFSYPIKQKVQSIFIDCFDNVHLLSKDSAYQIYIDSTLNIVDRVDIKTFNEVLKPCILTNEEYSFFGEFKDHNKTFFIYSIDHLKKLKWLKLTIQDEIAKNATAEAYNVIISTYYMTTPSWANILTMGIWDGDVYSLINSYTPLELFDKICFFKQVESREIICPRFVNEDESIIVFDHTNNQVLQVKDSAKVLSEFDFHLHKTYNNAIYQDNETNNYYGAFKEKGYLILKRIDIFTGEVTQVLVLNELGYPENIQINGGYVYFVKTYGSGFHKLKRVKLV